MSHWFAVDDYRRDRLAGVLTRGVDGLFNAVGTALQKATSVGTSLREVFRGEAGPSFGEPSGAVSTGFDPRRGREAGLRPPRLR